MLVPQSSLAARQDSLRRSQNPDGGWGYYPGKQSWLEPTVYAALALHAEPAADRAWDLLRSWQNRDGSFRPSAEVGVAGWGTALCLTLAAARQDRGPAARLAADWLLATSGVESRWVNRFAARVGWLKGERNLNLRGWPWKPGTSSWVEPTAHALVALKKMARHSSDGRRMRERIRLGHMQLFDVQCSDGGWNYGSRAALQVDLPSYPETTGIALVGLQDEPGLSKSLDLAARLREQAASPLARAWLTIALRVNGRDAAAAPAGPPPHDLHITALEALAEPEGHWRLLETESPG
jgi:hypothetical protein